MAITAQDQIDRVRRRLDELSETGAQDLSTTLVRDALADAMRTVFALAPAVLLYPAARSVAADATLTHVSTVVSDALTVTRARIAFGAPVLRILSVRLSGWLVPVSEGAIVDGLSEAYPAYVTGEGTATRVRPAAFLLHDAAESSGGVALECFPDDGAYTLAQCDVVPESLAPEQAPTDLIDAIIWQACSQIAGAYLKEPGVAGECAKNAETSLSAAAKKHERLAPRPRRERLTHRDPKPLG